MFRCCAIFKLSIQICWIFDIKWVQYVSAVTWLHRQQVNAWIRVVWMIKSSHTLSENDKCYVHNDWHRTLNILHLKKFFNKCLLYSCWGPGTIKIWRPLSVTINIGYASLLFLFQLRIKKLTFNNLREANVQIKPMDSISFLWRPLGDRLGRSHLKSALLPLFRDFA
jgi:hypothetical protein